MASRYETTVQEEYTVAVPGAVRNAFALEPGDRLRWIVDEDQITIEIVGQGYGVATSLEPIDMGVSDAVAVTEGDNRNDTHQSEVDRQ